MRRSGILRTFVTFGILCVLYVAIWQRMPCDTFFSPDEGGKLLQMESLSRGELVYPGETADPEGMYYPVRAEGAKCAASMCTARIYPFLAEDGQIQVNWANLFSNLTRPFYQWLGMRGLLVIPLLAGLAALFLVASLARKLQADAARLALVAVALSTPLLFYSLAFWEHTLALALQLGALACVLPGNASRKARLWRWVIAGVMLLGSIVLRREGVFFALAILMVPGWSLLRKAWDWPLRRKLVTGGLVLAGGLGGAWLLWRVMPERTAVDLYFTLWRILKWDSLAHLDIHFFDVFFLLHGGTVVPTSLQWIGKAGLLLCLVNAAWPRARRTDIFVLGMGMVLSTALWLALEPERYRALNSLALSAPFVLFALLPSGSPEAPGPAMRFVRWTAGWTALLTYLGTWPSHRGHGGLEWGSRYLLILTMMMVILGTVQAVRWLECRPGQKGRRLAMQLLILLALLAGCLSLTRGVNELRRTRKDLAMIQSAMIEKDLPVVTDCWWMAAALTDFYMRHEVYTVASFDELGTWAVTAGAGRGEFLVAGYDREPELFVADDEVYWIPTGSREVCGMKLITYQPYSGKRREGVSGEAAAVSPAP